MSMKVTMRLPMRSRTAEPAIPRDVAELLSVAHRVLIVTGAGISAAAGLATFRGAGGRFRDGEVTDPVLAEDLQIRPRAVSNFMNDFADRCRSARPTLAHRAIARRQAALTAMNGTVTVITLNLDDLHERAGARTEHLHGTAFDAVCAACDTVWLETRPGMPCGECGEITRPHAVLDGESVIPSADRAARKALRDADVMIAIGTSGDVWAPLDYAHVAREEFNCPTVAFGLQPTPEIVDAFDWVIDLEADALATVWPAPERRKRPRD